MLSRLLRRLHPVRRATTQEEREAIYRFRYSVFQELEREAPGLDHQKKQVRVDDDDAAWTTQLYVGSPDEVTAAMRVRCFAAGKVPAHVADEYSMDLIPGLEKYAVADFGPLLFRPSLGAGMIMHSVSVGCWELVGEQGIDLIFTSCRPNQVAQFAKLGTRLFGGRLINRPDALEVPLLALPSDDDYLRKMGSPAAGLAQNYFGAGKREPVDPKLFEQLFRSSEGSVVTDPAAVSTELQKALLGGRQPPVFLRSIDEGTVRRLAAQGFLLGVRKDAILAREGRSEQELFAVLEGTYDVSVKGRSVNTLGRGDLFGEVAFFTTAGRRSATVVATTPGRLVVIRKQFLDELAKKDPRAALVIVQNIARILAERLERITPSK